VGLILKKMFDDGLLFDDVNYVEQKLKEHLKVFIANIVVDHTNEIYELLVKSLRHNFNIAQEKMWGKSREEVSLKDIDDAMKKNHPLQE
jgi:arginine deiminase